MTPPEVTTADRAMATRWLEAFALSHGLQSVVDLSEDRENLAILLATVRVDLSKPCQRKDCRAIDSSLTEHIVERRRLHARVTALAAALREHHDYVPASRLCEICGLAPDG